METPIPNGFWRRMDRLLGPAQRETLLQAYVAPLSRGARINTLKCAAAQWDTVRPWPALSFAAQGRQLPEGWRPGTDPWHHAGAYYVQEPSAMAPVSVLAPQPGERVLDLCAAPGGKTTQIAAALAGQGVLWANDPVRSRAVVLRQNVERCGVRNAVVSAADPAVLCTALEGWCDAVLVDAPCSGEGMFRKEEAARAQWSEDYVALCARRQAAILDQAARAVVPGGRLVYSTCTLAPEENELVVAQFLHRHADFVLEPIGVSWGQPGFAWAVIRNFALPDMAYGAPAVDVSGCRRILPGQGGEGHFVARLRRIDGGTEAREWTEATDGGRHSPEIELVHSLYAECFSSLPAGTWTALGDQVWLRPPAVQAALDRASGSRLPLLAAGLAVGEVRGKRAEPCHAAFLASRPTDCRQCIDLPLDDPRLTAYLHGETLETLVVGWTAVAAQGVVTGFGKAVGGVLKNRYPKGLRLHM